MKMSWNSGVAKVEIYTREACGYCTSAKALLQKKGIAFIEFPAGDDPDKRREMVQRSHGGNTFPQIFINGRSIGGSDELHDLDYAGQLDAMLAEAA